MAVGLYAAREICLIVALWFYHSYLPMSGCKCKANFKCKLCHLSQRDYFAICSALSVSSSSFPKIVSLFRCRSRSCRAFRLLRARVLRAPLSMSITLPRKMEPGGFGEKEEEEIAGRARSSGLVGVSDRCALTSMWTRDSLAALARRCDGRSFMASSTQG